MPRLTAAWYVAHFGQSDALLARARKLRAQADEAARIANEALHEANEAHRTTEIYNGFPLTVREHETRVEVRSPANAHSAQAYLSAREGEGWCVNIDDHTHGDDYDRRNKTRAGGDWLGPRWTRDDAIAAAKSWVATGQRPVRPAATGQPALA